MQFWVENAIWQGALPDRNSRIFNLAEVVKTDARFGNTESAAGASTAAARQVSKVAEVKPTDVLFDSSQSSAWNDEPRPDVIRSQHHFATQLLRERLTHSTTDLSSGDTGFM